MKAKSAVNQSPAQTANRDRGRQAAASRRPFRSVRFTSWHAYIFATLVTVATLDLRLALAGQLKDRPTLIIFTVPIMLSVYMGGLRAGLLATALSFLGASYYLLPATHGLAVSSAVDRWDLFFEMLAGVIISVLNEALHRARRQADIAEEDHRRFFALSPDVFCTLGFDGYFKDLNPAWEKTLGYSKAELFDQPFIDFIHPDDRQVTLAEAEKVRGGQALMGFENRYRCKNGSYRCLQWNVTPVIGDQLMYGVARDITERNRIEDQLRASLKQVGDLETALDEHAIVAITDPQGRITHVNDKFCAISKYRREELLGQDHRIINSGHHPKEFIRDLWTTIAKGKVWHGEIKNQAKDGSFYWVDTTIVPFLNEDGKPRQYVAIRADITARKTVEEKFRRLNTELEQRVTERTAELEDANKELEAFSYSVSHDLRAPLRGVDGYIRMLQEDCADRLDAEGNRLLDVGSKEAKRMGRLIDDLLAFSRLGRAQMASTAIDMTALAHAVFESPTRAALESAPRFDVKSLPLARGDLSTLRQVFVNLIGNAVKFTRHQSAPVVEVGGRSGDGELTYYVKDNGVGFDEKYGHKLFGVFQRLHSETEFEGTGVGLALVQRVIQRHGGKVWAEGKLNQGATFYFTLPTRKKPANGQSH